jgi:TolB-like protein/DNA-binding winged helix-turn-helix (wHTH) protein
VPLSLYEFGEFELDCARFELRRNGRSVKIERIPMDLLILLAEKDGAAVTRREIIERLWGKDVFVDTEHGINTAIRKIRQALKDDPEQPRFVQTVTGKGYRFVAGAKNGNATLASPGEAKSTEPAEAAPAERNSWRLITITAITVCLVAVAVLVLNAIGVGKRIFARNEIGPIRSVAVLPLVNLSGDATQDYFADGMTDELTTALAKNRSLRVVSRTSAMQYKGVSRPLRDIARELGVDGIVEGSVVRSANHVHVTLQLIYAPADTHVWAESYDRDLSGALSLPQKLSQIIANQARVDSAPAKPQRYVSPEAHDAYLQGRYVWSAANYARTRQHTENAIQSRGYFEKAIRLQPDYAAAWSGLADSIWVKGVGGTAPTAEFVEKAEAAACKAVELDDSLPEAHNSMAAVYFFYKWDWNRADAECRRSLELDPNNTEGPPYALPRPFGNESCRRGLAGTETSNGN